MTNYKGGLCEHITTFMYPAITAYAQEDQQGTSLTNLFHPALAKRQERMHKTMSPRMIHENIQRLNDVIVSDHANIVGIVLQWKASVAAASNIAHHLSDAHPSVDAKKVEDDSLVNNESKPTPMNEDLEIDDNARLVADMEVVETTINADK